MTDTETTVCDTCRMKIPSELHVLAHNITHGPSHVMRRVILDEQNREVQA